MSNSTQPPSHDAFVAIGAERITDSKPQTAESLNHAQWSLVDQRTVLMEALDLALSVANDCQQRWSRGHPARVEAAQSALDAVRARMTD